MKFSRYESGQGLVALVLVLVAVIVLAGISYFFGFRIVLLLIGGLVGLWLFNGIIGAIFKNRYVVELLRQIQVVSLIFLMVVRVYAPQEHASRLKVDGILWRVFQFYKPALKQRGITYSVVPRPLPQVNANAPFVEDIFHHLISNAIKFDTHGSDSVIRIQGEVHLDRVRYTVTNHGLAISEADSDRVFNWFFRAQHSRSFGLGIGLSIVRFLVTRMGGECGIIVDSADSTTVWFTLPSVDAASEESL